MSSVQEPPDTDPDPISAEREHLARSRAELARMRAKTAALDTSAAGDWVSQQVLESTIYLRMKALEDDPTVPLFFGRLDYDDAHEDARGERFYIGRRHVQLLLVKSAVAGCPDRPIGCVEPKATGIAGFIVSLTGFGKIILPGMVGKC